MRACPRCGNPVTNTCYHEGDDVQSVEMDVEKAVELVRGEIENIESDIEGKKETLNYLLQDTVPDEMWLESNGFEFVPTDNSWQSETLEVQDEILYLYGNEVPKKATIGNIKRIMEAIQ